MSKGFSRLIGLALAAGLLLLADARCAEAQQPAGKKKPNILVIWGDDIG